MVVGVLGKEGGGEGDKESRGIRRRRWGEGFTVVVSILVSKLSHDKNLSI